MSKLLRHALLGLIWSPSLAALQSSYRKIEAMPLTAHERESVAIIFNDLVHHHALESNQAS